MFGIGMGELILILIVGLVLFGAEGLRDVARLFGKVMKEFRKAQASLQETLDDIDEKPKKSDATKSHEKNKDQLAKNTNPIETYQPPTQESVRASLEKISNQSQTQETQSESQSEIKSETISKEEKNLG